MVGISASLSSSPVKRRTALRKSGNRKTESGNIAVGKAERLNVKTELEGRTKKFAVEIGYDDSAKGFDGHTCAVLFEPIQCEAGVLMPPDGFLRELRALCTERNVLMIADEIQTGLGRTGRMFACEHDDVAPDMYILGKALSGGFYPVSAVVSRRDVLGVFEPGSHGSTFGGNPLGCAVAREAMRVIQDELLVERSARLGVWLLERVRQIADERIVAVRGRGLMIAIELSEPARPFCEALKERGVLCKETHSFVIRLSPPLVVQQDDLAWAVEQLRAVFAA